METGGLIPRGLCRNTLSVVHKSGNESDDGIILSNKSPHLERRSAVAECTSHCDFRFTDLKKIKLTVYLLADPTRMSVYASWLVLLAWCALTELIRFQNSNYVCFLCEEITNFKIKLWLIVQELEQWALAHTKPASLSRICWAKPPSKPKP